MPDSAAFRVSDKRVAYARRDSKTNPIPIGVWENLPLYMAEPQAILLEALTQNEIAQGKKPAVLWVLPTGGDQRDKIVVPLDYLVHVRDADGRKRPRKTNTITTSRRVGAGALRDMKGCTGG